ncbi:glycosyltransferase family 2 protein [Candidatus Omnitrophota bacterium]
MSTAISVVVMAFNEAGSLEPAIREIETVLRELGRPYEILVVDDGSPDDTGKIADRLAQKSDNIRVIHHEANKGLGGVYRTGFQNARGKLITFFPADMQFPADIIKQFVPLMDNADMVLGYIPDRKSSLLAKSLSACERVLYSILFGPLPRFQGILMFRRTLLDGLKLKSSGRSWTILMELIVRTRKTGHRIVSVPTGFRPRAEGRSKVNNFATIWVNLTQVLALRRDF